MLSMKACSGQNHGNKIALQFSFNPTAVNIMDLLHIFESINNTFFSVLVIIFSNMSYFCFNYTNTHFIHAMNYFSVVPWIIFLMCIKNYFFAVSQIYFLVYSALRALHLKWTGWSLWPPLTILKTFHSRSQKSARTCTSEVLFFPQITFWRYKAIWP